MNAATSAGGDGPISAGAEVVDAGGERLGSVVAAAEGYIVVERGFFFPTDFYIPRSAIATVEEGAVQLTVTKSDALAKGWEVNPGEESANLDPVLST